MDVLIPQKRNVFFNFQYPLGHKLSKFHRKRPAYLLLSLELSMFVFSLKNLFKLRNTLTSLLLTISNVYSLSNVHENGRIF